MGSVPTDPWGPVPTERGACSHRVWCACTHRAGMPLRIDKRGLVPSLRGTLPTGRVVCTQRARPVPTGRGEVCTRLVAGTCTQGRRGLVHTWRGAVPDWHRGPVTTGETHTHRGDPYPPGGPVPTANDASTNRVVGPVPTGPGGECTHSAGGPLRIGGDLYPPVEGIYNHRKVASTHRAGGLELPSCGVCTYQAKGLLSPGAGRCALRAAGPVPTRKEVPVPTGRVGLLSTERLRPVPS